MLKRHAQCTYAHAYICMCITIYLLVKIRKLRHAIIFAIEITLFHQTMGMPITRNQQVDKFVCAKELVFVSPYSHAMSTFVCNSLGLILWRLPVYYIRFEGQRATAINIYLSRLPHTNDLIKTYICSEKQILAWPQHLQVYIILFTLGSMVIKQ